MTRDLPPRGKNSEAIYERRFDMVYRVCFLYMRNKSDTEDAVSTVFVKLLEQDRIFDSEEHEKAWLIRVTINHCKSRLRAPWHTRRLPLEHLDEAILDREVGRHVDTVESLRASIAQLKEQSATPQAAAEAGWNDGMLKI